MDESLHIGEITDHLQWNESEWAACQEIGFGGLGLIQLGCRSMCVCLLGPWLTKGSTGPLSIQASLCKMPISRIDFFSNLQLLAVFPSEALR